MRSRNQAFSSGNWAQIFTGLLFCAYVERPVSLMYNILRQCSWKEYGFKRGTKKPFSLRNVSALNISHVWQWSIISLEFTIDHRDRCRNGREPRIKHTRTVKANCFSGMMIFPLLWDFGFVFANRKLRKMLIWKLIWLGKS